MTDQNDIQAAVKTVRGTNQCFCVGPQNGQPLCPCRMRSVKIKSGRYIEVIDHGPVPPESDSELAARWDETMRRFLG